MYIAPSEAVKRVRKWEWQKCKIDCVFVFPGLDITIALRGRVSVREGRIVLKGRGSSELSLLPVDTLTFRYNNGYLVISGVGWWCGLWEPDD